MRKKIILASLLICLILVGLVAKVHISSNQLKLSEEEKNFIVQNRNSSFSVGYYNTRSESLFANKLCKRIEKDTGLKLNSFENIWDNNLKLIESGELPILLNMNILEQREEFCNFTTELNSLRVGIYSFQSNKIDSYSDIKGKKIGIESGVVFAEDLKCEYPKLQFEIVEYDKLLDVKQALYKQEINGFITTKTFDSDLKELNYFEIPSLSQGNNYIGISKEYPLLHSIISKELAYLKSINWGTTVSEIINFELEKSSLNYTDEETMYLENLEFIKVGLPTEYFLYVYGEEYNPQGVLSKILEKIEFILDVNIVYIFDTVENLRLRSDIDFYIDNKITKNYNSTMIFADDAIIIGTINKKVINEIYDMALFNIGILGVADAKNYLLEQMPQIKLVEYTDEEVASTDLKKNRIDYLIIPKLYVSSVKGSKNLTQKGELWKEYSRFVSDNHVLIKVVNKCLAIIDINKIIADEITEPAEQNVHLVYFIIFGVLLATAYVLYMIYKTLHNYYYKDNVFGLYNSRYLLKRKLKRDVYFIIIEFSNSYELIAYYGEKVFKKYVKKIVTDMNKTLSSTEHIYFLDGYKLLVVKEENILAFCSDIKYKEEQMINKALLPTDVNVCYMKHLQIDRIIDTLNKLNACLPTAKDKDLILEFDDKQEINYHNKNTRDYDLKHIISNGKISIEYKNIINCDGYLLASLVSPKIDQKAYPSLLKSAVKFNVEKRLDIRILNHIKTKLPSESIMIDISEKTLMTNDFFNWVNENVNKGKILYLLVNFDFYEAYFDVLNESINIEYVIKDFGKNIKNDFSIKYYKVSYVLIDPELTYDIEENEETLKALKSFSLKYDKKIISYSSDFKDADYFIKEIDYENIDR